MKGAILSLGLLVAAVPARADEEAIKVEELPAAVRTAVKAKFPEAKVVAAAREEEEGKAVYEVSLKEHGVEIDVAVSAKGKILEVERTIAAEKLPEAVAAAIKSKYPAAEVKKAEEVVEFEDGDDEEEKSYEVALSVGGKVVEVKFSPKGKILDDEDEEGDDDGAREKDED